MAESDATQTEKIRPNRLQVILEPWEVSMIAEITSSEGRKTSAVLKDLIEIGLFTLLNQPNEIEKRLRRVRGADQKTLLEFLAEKKET